MRDACAGFVCPLDIHLTYQYKYNGKEFQGELGLNLYDYGARNYDPAIGRWMNMDQLAEKYNDIGPYVYAANMPTIAIDPDGNEIIFIVKKDNAKSQEFKYSKGNFYHSNGQRYNPGKEGISKTMYKVLTAYRKIEASNDPYLKKILNTLETSSQKHIVKDGPKNGVRRDVESSSLSETKTKVKEGKPLNTETSYNLSEEEKKSIAETVDVPFTDFTIIVHEMQHQFDYDQGNMADAEGMPSTAKSPAEIRAVNTENKARKIEKLPKRTKYGSREIDPKKLD